METEDPPELAPREGGMSQAETVEEEGEKDLADQNQNANEGKDDPELLPLGWVLEIKTQNGGKCNGKQKKSYYNPSIGSRFYSKKKLLQHLSASKILIPATRETRSTTSSYNEKASSPTNPESTIKDGTFDNVLTECDSKSLPKGWITEIRASKLGNLEYKVHIDPDSGYEFRSMKDAHRYILTRDIRQCILKPQKRNTKEPHTVEREVNFPTSKRLEWQSNGTKRSLFSDKSPDSGVKINANINKSLDISGAAVDSTNNTSLPYPKQSDGENSKVEHSPSLRQWNENMPVSVRSDPKKRRQSRPNKRRRANELRDTISKVVKPIKKPIRASVKPVKKPLRASKRLAALRDNQITNSSEAGNSHRAKADAFSQLQEKTATALDQPYQSNSSFYQQKKMQFEDLEAANELERNTHIGDTSTVQQIHFGRSGNEKPYGSTFSSPWSDPCLEFAFKMLTSDIPVFEDTDKVQEYFTQFTSTNNISTEPTSFSMNPSSR
ncbi:uncharacterized protein LOC122022578 isoform X1 [Zingiber officinale]|uniref:MBD domain-containing protein n=1 Tax=Zingiber officinale TaxID=94328 RepID=A0A8J5KDF6_ZINOF|nr:uncharacterized protein LOC122022578 isoform X1 [Zingiber officinale]KAG6476613.1 hypothetical protein ZIOFF_065858 [Zingiber officinale]